VLARGSGATVWDVDGKRYVDLLGGIAVNLLGHAHPAVVEAVTRQLSTLGHTSNLAAHAPGSSSPSGSGSSSAPARQPRLFTNSGAEATRPALKLSRRLRPGGGWVACDGAFHGRTSARSRSPGSRRSGQPVRSRSGPVPSSRTATPRPARRRLCEHGVRLPRAGDGGGRVVVPPAGFLEARGRLRRARRAAPPRRGAGRCGPGRRAWLTSAVTATRVSSPTS
jgi:acetylornithine aminotransferase